MKTIPSFEVDHEKLYPWIYVSRKDFLWTNVITTFDIRLKKPNIEPVIDNPAIHSMEHIWATFLRNHKKWWNKTVYFWPMWCRTGFYTIFLWDINSKDILDLVKELFVYISIFEWKIPWCSSKWCWNYLDHNLSMANYESKVFLEKINNFTEKNLNYPN